jgi:hypothetical protein
MVKGMNYPAFLVSICGIELALTTSVLLVAVVVVARLHLDLRTRFLISSIFALGGVSIVTGIVRIQQTYFPGESSVDIAGDMFWPMLHSGTAIIAANMPLYRPMLRSVGTVITQGVKKMYRPPSQSQGSSEATLEGKSDFHLATPQSIHSKSSSDHDSVGVRHHEIGDSDLKFITSYEMV